MLEIIEQQERILQFQNFSNQDALAIGGALIKAVKNLGMACAVEITVNDWLVFKFAMDGASPENDNWIERKRNMLNYLRHSTLYIQKKFAGKNIEKDLFLDEKLYSMAGGAFPISLGGCVAGSIIVSGLPDTLDHQIIVDVLNKHLNKNAPSIL